jgi:hypothetical protein
MRPQFYVAGFLVAGFFGFGSLSFGSDHGRGHSEHQEHQEHQEHHRYDRHDWYGYGPWYPGSQSYDSNYPFAYVATAEQMAEAKKCVQTYFTATQRNQRRPAKRRYIAVQTLRPSSRQRAQYEQKRREAETAAAGAQDQLSNHWVAPENLNCLMIFDTQTKQFVGSNCYAVGTLPAVGEVVKFETFPAEFVGKGT